MSYSALTRHFHRSHMVTSEQAERIAAQAGRAMNDTREITVADKRANVAKAFANQPEKDSAFTLAERVRVLRQGGIRQFQQVLLPAQPGQRVGRTASAGPAIVQSRRLQTGIATQVRAMRLALQHGVEKAQRIVRMAPRIRHEVQRGPSLRL